MQTVKANFIFQSGALQDLVHMYSWGEKWRENGFYKSYRRPHFLHGHLGHAAFDHVPPPFTSSFSVLITVPNPILQAFSQKSDFQIIPILPYFILGIFRSQKSHFPIKKEFLLPLFFLASNFQSPLFFLKCFKISVN